VLFSVCLACMTTSAYSQAIRTPVSASFTRLNTYSSRHANAFSFVANQAALASIKEISGGIYSEKKFLLKELGLYSTAFVLPVSKGSFGVKGDYFGDPSYNETAAGLAYGRSLGNKIDIGIQFNYNSFKVAGYGSASCINAEGGILVHLTEDLNVGFHVYNPTSVAIGKTKEEKLPSIYSAGFGYDVSERFFLGVDIEKIENEPVNINAGLQYYFVEKLWVNVGLASATSAYYLGFGVALQNIKLNIVASVHPQLGITPGLMLLFNTSKKSE
jgi:hypothetical protein